MRPQEVTDPARLQEAAAKLSEARTILLLGSKHPATVYYAAVLSVLENVEMPQHLLDRGIPPTMAVDAGAMRLYTSSEFVIEQALDTVCLALIHEAQHIVRATSVRAGNRVFSLFSLAHDVIINESIFDEFSSAFVVDDLRVLGATYDKLAPAGVTRDDETAEQIYEKLVNCNNKGSDAGKQAIRRMQADHNDVLSGGASDAEIERNCQRVVIEASKIAEAMKPGSTPGYVSIMIDKLKDGQVSWAERIRSNISDSIGAADWDYRTPDRRSLHAGVIMPSERVERAGTIVVAVDVSGSVLVLDRLETLVSEIQGIFEQTRPETVYVVYADAAVKHVQEFTDPTEFTVDAGKVAGGGGTYFDPPLRWVSQNAPSAQHIVYLTDGFGRATYDPHVPVTWCVAGNKEFSPAFGEVVHLE